MARHRGSRWISACRAFLRDERGQGFTEYVLLLSAVVVGAGAMGKALMRALDRGILTFGGALEKHLKTGKAPLNVWEN